MKLISFIFAAVVLASTVYGQSQAAVSLPEVETVVEVADQAGCPLKLSVRTISSGRIATIQLDTQSLSDKPIIGHTLVQSGDTWKGLSVVSRPGDPIVKDKASRSFATGALDQKHIIISVDYVEFADGTSWGEDAYKQSVTIKQFASGWDLAMTRLRSLITDYEDPEFFIKRGTLGGMMTWSTRIGAGDKLPPAPPSLEYSGYDQVLRNLRLRSQREAECQEIARKLELMRTPNPTNK